MKKKSKNKQKAQHRSLKATGRWPDHITYYRKENKWSEKQVKKDRQNNKINQGVTDFVEAS